MIIVEKIPRSKELKQTLLTVLCSALNDRNYICQALDSIMRQETAFEFNVIIRDFGSTDDTCEEAIDCILNHWAGVYTYRRSVNPLSASGDIDLTASSLNLGKYLAFCNGRDYWTSPYKLQRQVDFLEAHEETAFVVHNVHKSTSKTNLNQDLQNDRGRWFSSEAVLNGQRGQPSTKVIRTTFSKSHNLPPYSTPEQFANLELALV